MPFPDGTPTKLVHLTVTSPASGKAGAGTVRLTPNVPAVVIDGTPIQFTGGGTYQLDSQGRLVDGDTVGVRLLDNSAPGTNPAGWLWQAIINVAGQPRPFYFSLEGQPDEVDLAKLQELDPERPDYVAVPGPRGLPGPAGADGAPGSPGTPGGAGADGESAYQVAVAAGFVGTEAEWLASLVGPQGDEGPQPPLGAAGAGPTIALKSNDPSTSNARTPTSHAATHEDGGSDELTLSQAQITDLVAALAALLPKAGGILSGDLTIDGHNLTVQREDGTGAYRLRVTGGGLDFEIGGLDVFLSAWENADFTGTQADVMRLEPAGPHLIGRTQFGTSPFDNVHDIDAGTGVAALGAKNSLTNIRFCGRLATTGAPATGTWAAGDTVQDADGALWMCTTSGTPGVWTGSAASSPWVFDITKYGAKGDAVVVHDGAVALGVPTLTCATSAPFHSGLVGKPVLIQGAGTFGVTAFKTTFASYSSPTSMGLTDAPPTSITGAVVAFGTNSYTAIRAATTAAEAYLAAGHTYAEVYSPPGGYILDGPLDTSKAGNGQVPVGAYPTTGVKKVPHFRGVGSGAGVRHWEQQVPQFGGSCWISFGFYSSTSAQISDLNANGNPGIISGPNEGTGNGLAYGAAARFSNIMPMITNMAFLLPHTAYGITYGAWNFYGCANAHVTNVSIATLGVVPGSDYGSPGTFGTGLSIAALMPAPGNNDLTLIRNLSIQGGFTYGLFFSEHTLIDRVMVLYCWAALCPVGSYAGSVGAVHPMKVLTASIEACGRQVYFIGVGSEGVGPRVDIDQLQTESGTPTFDGNSTAALAGAEGKIMLTGLFTRSGVSIAQPSGIELIDGQSPRAIVGKTSNYTAGPLDRTVIMDTTASPLTLTLPNADYQPVECTVKNVGSNDLTVATTSSQLIYTSSGTGATTTTVPTGQTLSVQALYNGSAWGWYAILQPSVDLFSDQHIAGNKTFSWYTVLEGGQVNGEFHLLGTAGFFGATPAGRQTVTGAKGGNAALASLINALVALGLITDTTT